MRSNLSALVAVLLSLAAAALLAAISLGSSPASAAYVTVYGGPTYDAATQTGYQSPGLPVSPGRTAGNGVAVGYAEKYAGGTMLGPRAFRWDASGSAATELVGLGTSISGFTNDFAYAVNTAGTAVGSANKYTGGSYLGQRAVRWEASGTAATELGNLGTSSSGNTYSEALAVNTAGTAVGYASKYTLGTDFGTRAVRWAASGTAATELGNLGTDSGHTTSVAYAVNTAGTAVGVANLPYVGTRAVRWDASDTAATELGSLSSGGRHIALAVNTAGTTVGFAETYSGDAALGRRAVRWAASGTAATELGNLGTDSSGFTSSIAYSVNDAGTAVGYAGRWDQFNNSLGDRAVRWDASGSAATELGNLGGDGGSRGSYSNAYAINAAGFAVGIALKFTDGTVVGYRAALWDPDGAAFDLNTLIHPNSGWTLTEARGISDTNWVTGYGGFDPDGAGPQAAYTRAFLLDASSLVPEPSSLALLPLGVTAILRRRRLSRLRPRVRLPG